MNNPSFRNVLHALKASQIEAYLLRQAWQRESEVGDPIQRFELHEAELENDYKLRFWPDRETKGYIDAIFKLVFNLSCIEDREPMQVAQDILQESIPKTHSLANVCIATIITQGLDDSPKITEEHRTRVLQAVTPKIAQADFMCTALGDGVGSSEDAALMKLALVLVPFAQILSAVAGHETARIVFSDALGDALSEESYNDDPPTTHFDTFHADCETAPKQALALLKELRKQA